MISKQKVFWKKPVFWQLVCNPKGQFLLFITRKALKEIGKKCFHLTEQGINISKIAPKEQHLHLFWILDAIETCW